MNIAVILNLIDRISPSQISAIIASKNNMAKSIAKNFISLFKIFPKKSQTELLPLRLGEHLQNNQ